jgi:GT2 family glycosyltransferase
MTVEVAARRWGALRTKVVTVDLDEGITDVTDLDGYAFAMVVVRFGGEPVGSLLVPVEGDRCLGRTLAEVISTELAEPLLRIVLLAAMETSHPGSRLDLDAVTLASPRVAPTPASRVTVAVCTRDRPARLRRCLEALLAQCTAPQILVVDNAPSSDASARLVAERFSNVGYVVEPRPGLDHARNRAIDASTTEIIAFTDDDAVADDRWTTAIATAFDEEPDLAMVTGLVVPLELETPAQHIFERLGGFGRGVVRRWVSVDPSCAGRRLGTGELGTGANMAFRRSALREVGGFDPALDVGTPTGGGGDHDVFHRVLAAGMLVRYEPAAIVFHEHRRSMTALRDQIRNNGSVWSMMTAARLAGRADVADVARVMRWYATAKWPRQMLHAWLIPNRVPLGLPATEISGFATAALGRAYRRSRALNGASQRPLLVADDARVRPSPGERRDGPIAVTTIDVTGPQPVGLGTVETVVVVTSGPRAVGRLHVAARRHPLSARAWRELIVDECGIDVLATCDGRAPDVVRADALARLRAEIRQRGESSAAAPFSCSASIVIATLDRPRDLESCLRLVVEQRSRHPFEVIVVDNNPASGLTSPVCDRFPDVIRVVEPRRGLAYARNAGIRRATGVVVVTTDDDVRVPAGWLDVLLEPFRRNDVMAVCGNVQPLELRNETQIDFERISPLGKGFRRFESRWEHPTRPWTAFPAWELGATANAAFRRSVFDDEEVGLMEEALGPGMPSGVGEDSYLMYRIVRAGFTVVYEPSAYVWHRHRDSPAALASQITNYYSGHVAHQLTTLLRDHDPRAVHRLARVGAYVTVSKLRSLVGRGPVAQTIASAQLRGTLRGPLNYVRSQQRVRRDGRGPWPGGGG